MRAGGKWLVAAVAVLVGGVASAHELSCALTFNGSSSGSLDGYPATVQVGLTIRNVHPTAASTALSVETGLLADLGFSVPTPFTLDVGEASSFGFSFVLPDEQACLRLDALDGHTDGKVTAQVTVTWDLGHAQCSAELICRPAQCR